MHQLCLSVFAFNGWFIGMQNAKPDGDAIINNVLNIVLSFTFVYGFDMKIKGIALGNNAFAGDNTSYLYRFWLAIIEG